MIARAAIVVVAAVALFIAALDGSTRQPGSAEQVARRTSWVASTARPVDVTAGLVLSERQP